MKRTQDFDGKDIESAVKNACTQLNISKADLDYDVISSGASGIFGIVGRKNARIRVVLPDNKTDDALSAEREAHEGIMSLVDEAFGEETGRNDRYAPQAPDFDEAEEPEADARGEAVETVSDELVALGKEALQNMVDLITDDAKVRSVNEDDKLYLKVDGGNAGMLIGRKGQTLEAMQFLTDKIINRKSEGRVRVKVDIEGYMETRKANLVQLAHKMADKCKKTGKPATINQISGQDRRIIHLALKDDTQVRTQSKGEGYYRRLVILPRKKGGFRGKKRYKQ